MSEAPVHRFAASRCPFCGYKLDSASPVDNDPRPPQPGDLSMCVGCGEWIVFADDQGNMRKPSDAEYEEIAGDRALRLMRSAWVGTRGGTKPS